MSSWAPILPVLAVLAAPAGFHEAPPFVRLFTPRGAPPGAYRAYVSADELDRAVAALRTTPGFGTTGSLQPRATSPLDAFGRSGDYNRWKVALLYGGGRARVVRAPRVENGQVVEIWTLISPYPDAALERLEPGTLLIVLRLDTAAAAGPP